MTTTHTHRTTEALHSGLREISESPHDAGVVKLIVRRPAVDAREVLAEGNLNVAEGLVGDSWSRCRSSRTADGTPHPAMQINVMNARVAALIAGEMSRWPLAGDQRFVDLDLSAANLPRAQVWP